LLIGALLTKLDQRTVTERGAVSIQGGLLALDAKVKRGQTVLLVNAITEDERECRVVYVESRLWGKRKIVVEFTYNSGDFWHVYPSLIRSK
jgi:hypothetical protein